MQTPRTDAGRRTRARLALPASIALLLFLVVPTVHRTRAEVAAVTGGPEQGLLWIFGKTSDPDPLPDFVQVRPVDPASLANGGGNPILDRQPDLMMREGLPPTVVFSKWSGSEYEIAFTQRIYGAWTAPVVLTDSADNDMNPRVAFDLNGLAIVAWCRAGLASSEVWVTRQRADLTWTAETRVSGPSELARFPSIALSGDGRVRIAYELDGVTSRDIEVVVEEASEPGEFDPETSFPTGLSTGIDLGAAGEPILETRGARTWVTWADAETSVGFAQFSGGRWLPAGQVPCSGVDDFEAARYRVRDIVLN
jgi:hypothetical protein